MDGLHISELDVDVYRYLFRPDNMLYEVYHASNYTNSMSTKQSFTIAEILTVTSSWNSQLLQTLSYYGFLLLLLMKNV
jgi:hypothetical protein